MRNDSHHPLEMGLRARVAQIPLMTKKRQGEGGICLLALDLIRTGSMSVSLQVLSLFSSSATHYPFPRPPLPPYTAPNFSPIPTTRAIYLASVPSELSALLV